MKSKLRLGLAQINCTVGDLEGNYQKISDYIQKAKGYQADIVVFPELAITGYPPEDLLLKPSFVSDNLKKIKELTKGVGKITVVTGFVDRKQNSLYNAAAIIYQGKLCGVYHKMFLPNYGVFDEKRYFQSGSSPLIFCYGDYLLGINICEDIWHLAGPTRMQARLGAKLILNINASPYHAGKTKERETMIRQQARLNKVFVAYLNLVGGQDELVFDGQSMVVDNQGRLIAHASALKEDLLLTDIELPASKPRKNKQMINIAREIIPQEPKLLVPKLVKPLGRREEIYQVLLLGLGDYVRKNSFSKVVVGLSGGIDSSLVACLAVDALGKDNVIGVYMPSRFSSSQSESDARGLSQNLGVQFLTIPIEEVYQAYLNVFQPHFSGLPTDITEENLQARIRGNILMALSNKFRWLVLTTGNKSEMSTGYATLYGDMAGGFAVLKDVPKMLVYELSRYRNEIGKIIPEAVFTKAPTAELRENQKDTDSLPPYETLDKIIKAYVEEDKDLAKIIALGFPREVVSKVTRLVDRSEYKRRQSPPGIKITYKAFGKDRRMPITNKYTNGS